ncbi:MAG: lipopolysaccharide heptosyltransferase II [Candidatus Omnitrophica bacterium]|nr:lipopolysaccharide heptosyltransferase II [Candidatus Omnitrophota bacterium]
MNILQILPELNFGGVEVGTLDLAKYLLRQGHKVVIVSGGGQLVKDLESLGALHYQLPVNRKSLFTIIRMVKTVIEIIRKEGIDIVHARSRVPAWIAYFACRKTHTVFITTCHGYYRKHIFSRVMGWAKRVIVISNVIARHMIDDFNVPYERIRLIPRSVDLERFKFISPEQKRKDEFNVGIIGRLTPLKGHLYFVKAMAKLVGYIPNLKVWIVGDAPSSKSAYKQQIQLLVKRLGLDSITMFLGNQKDIPAIMEHLDVLVLATTTQEAFGRVIIEAQASGVPVVATKVGGVIDIIEDNKTGLLVSPYDHSAIAEAVLRIYKDIDLACQLANEAYRKVTQRYTLELMAKNTLEVYEEALSSFKILIIKISSLGDVVLSTASLRQIRKHFPLNYKIYFLVGKESKEILLHSPYIDELLVCDFNNRDKGLFGLFSLGGYLKKKDFDIVIDLQNSRKSHLLAYLSGAPQRYGYDRKFGFLLNYRIKDDRIAIDPVQHQFRILSMLNIELDNPYLELWMSKDDQDYIDRFLNEHWISSNQKLVGISISASERWQTKSWPLEYIKQLCEELSKQDIRVVLTGIHRDLERAESLIRQIKHTRSINACNKTTLNQLACLIKRCDVYVGFDSASLHIASAVKTPFVALFGPTDFRRHLPPANDFVVIKKDLACSPCYKPRCKSNKCMKAITPEEVVEAILKLCKG